MACMHPHGDQIPHIGWVCGKCYAVLTARPQRLGMRPFKMKAGDADYRTGTRQEIIWQAEISTADGVRLARFVKWCAQRFMWRGGLDEAEAYRQAIEGLRAMDEEYGDPGVDWSRSGAIDVADEEMSYWDCDEAAGGNA